MYSDIGRGRELDGQFRLYLFGLEGIIKVYKTDVPVVEVLMPSILRRLFCSIFLLPPDDFIQLRTAPQPATPFDTPTASDRVVFGGVSERGRVTRVDGLACSFTPVFVHQIFRGHLLISEEGKGRQAGRDGRGR